MCDEVRNCGVLLAVRHFVITVLVLAVSITPVSGQASELIETFDDPALPGWEHSADVTVANGIVVIPTNGFLAVPGAWGDFSLVIRLRRMGGEGNLLLFYHATDATSNYLSIHGSGFALGRRENGQLSELHRESTGAPATDWFVLTLQVTGGHHVVLVNNQTVIDFTEPTSPLPSATVILNSRVVSVEVDEIILTGSGQLTPPAEQRGETFGLPAYTSDTWIRLGGPPGGLGYDIRMQPDNPNIMYVTDANAGIHKSVDGGQSWLPINEGVSPMVGGGAPIFSATIDPHDYNTVWIGVQNIGHLYRSTNGGQMWEARDNGIVHEGRSVRGITVDPNDPNVVYAGVEVSSFAWAGQPIGKRHDLVKGEVYQSVDAGLTWARIWEGNNLARYVWVDPGNSNRLYVSTGIFDRDAADSDVPNGVWGGVGILRSDDGGQTWTILNEANGLGGLYIPSLFMHPDDSDILLAGVSGTADNPGAYVTRDGGDTWERLSIDSHGRGIEAVEIAAGNANIWYAAAEGIMWRSDDAGQTWIEYRIGTPNRDAGFPIDLQVDPRDPYRIFDNNYGGGNFLSEDGGESWTDASNGYTGIKLSGDIAVAPGSEQTVFADVFRSDDGGQTWNAMGAVGAASYQFFDATHFLFADVGGRVWHSEDSGQIWHQVTVLNTFQASETGQIADDVPLQRALVIAPSDPRIAYTGFVSHYCLESVFEKCLLPSGGLYRSNDGGYAWEGLPDAPFHGVAVLRIAVHPDDSRLLYAATANGLFRSRDGGDSWEHLLFAAVEWSQLSPELLNYGLNAPIIFDIVLDPFDPQIMIAALSLGGVWRSTDAGETWQQATAGMDPNEPIYTILPDPNHPGVYYASSDISGVFYSTDGATTWQKLGNNLPFTNVRGLALSASSSVLYAGTVGSGVYRLGTP